MTRLSLAPLLASLFLTTACAAQSHPHPTDRRHAGPSVIAGGSATVEREPDRAMVTLGISQRAPTAEAAQDAVNRAMSRIIEDTRALKIEGTLVQTSGVSLFPIYEDRNPRQSQAGQPPELKVVGVNASSSVTVRIDDVARVGEVIDAAINAGANQVSGVNFTLRDDTEARAEALRLAVHAARHKAETMANAAGHTLGPLTEISEASDIMPISRSFARAGLAMESSMAPTPVEGGRIAVNASVSIIYSLGPRKP